MHRIQGPEIDTSTGVNLFKKTPPYTVVTPEWMDAVQEEIMNCIIQSGQPVNDQISDTKDQLWKSITQTILAYNAASIKYTSSDYPILDDDGYTEIWVTTGAVDVNIYLPTGSDNYNRKITVRKIDSGIGKAIVHPEGSEYINNWNAPVEITEQWGWWEFTRGLLQWTTKTDGWSTIYRVSTETADTGLTLDETWDDVAGMALSLTCRGFGYLDAYVRHYVEDSSYPTYLSLWMGLGTVSGNNAPNIPEASDYDRVYTNGEYMYNRVAVQRIQNCPYEVSSNQTIYMKAAILTSESPATQHNAYGAPSYPMFIKWRRIS